MNENTDINSNRLLQSLPENKDNNDNTNQVKESEEVEEEEMEFIPVNSKYKVTVTNEEIKEYLVKI